MTIAYLTSERTLRIVTLTFTGRLDAVSSRAMRIAFTAAVEQGCDELVADLSEVFFLDSAALAALVSAMKAMATQGGSFRIVPPTSGDAMRIFQLTRFDRVFGIAPNSIGR